MSNKQLPQSAQAPVKMSLEQLSSTMAGLTSQTLRTYLWRWFVPCQGLKGDKLAAYLKEAGVAYQMVDQTRALDGTVTLTYCFCNPHAVDIKNRQRAAQLDFRVITKKMGSDDLRLAFGHREIPFPADIKIQIA